MDPLRCSAASSSLWPMSFVPNPAVVDGCWQPGFSLPFALCDFCASRVSTGRRPMSLSRGVRARFASLAKTAWGLL